MSESVGSAPTVRRGDRPPISELAKAQIREMFQVVPEGRRSAVVSIVDEHGARLHVASRLGEHWKVGGVVGVPWGERPSGSVAIEASW